MANFNSDSTALTNSTVGYPWLQTALTTAAAAMVPVGGAAARRASQWALDQFGSLPANQGAYSLKDFSAAARSTADAGANAQAVRKARGADATRGTTTAPDYSNQVISLGNGTSVPFTSLAAMSVNAVADIVRDLARQPPDAAGASWYQKTLQMIDYLTRNGKFDVGQALRHMLNALSPFVVGIWKAAQDVLKQRPDLGAAQIRQLVQKTIDEACKAAQQLQVKYGPKGHAIADMVQTQVFTDKWLPTWKSLAAAADALNVGTVVPQKAAELTEFLKNYWDKIAGAYDLNQDPKVAGNGVDRLHSKSLLDRGELAFGGTLEELVRLLRLLPVTDLENHGNAVTYLRSTWKGIKYVYHVVGNIDQAYQVARKEGALVYRSITENQWSEWKNLNAPSTPAQSKAMAEVFKTWYESQKAMENQVLFENTPLIGGR